MISVPSKQGEISNNKVTSTSALHIEAAMDGICLCPVACQLQRRKPFQDTVKKIRLRLNISHKRCMTSISRYHAPLKSSHHFMKQYGMVVFPLMIDHDAFVGINISVHSLHGFSVWHWKRAFGGGVRRWEARQRTINPTGRSTATSAPRNIVGVGNLATA